MRKFLAALALLGASLFFGAYLISAALASRNSTGTYSLAQPPFISGTVINSGTMNSQFSDLGTALTDSLSRSGSGGMLAPLGLTDGTVTSPSLKFNNEAGTGFYRAGAGDLRAAIAGLDVGQWNAGAYRTGDGTLAAPAHSFISETGTGWYRAGASNPALSVAGTKRLECTSTGCIVTGTFAAGSTTLGATSVTGPLTVTQASAATVDMATYFDSTLGNGNLTAIRLGKANTGASDSAGFYYKANATAALSTGCLVVSGQNDTLCVDGNGKTTTAGNLTAASLTVGASGTAISGSFAGSTPWTPGSIAAGSSGGTTIAVTGAVAGSPCVMGTPAPNTALSLTCYVTLNSCNVTLFNPTAAPTTGSAGTYQCRVFNP